MSGSAPSTIAVTGASGFIGKAVVQNLARAGHTVRALYHRKPPPAGEATQPAIANLHAPLDDNAALGRALAGTDAVVHAAGIAHVSHAAGAYREVNVEGSAAVLEAAVAGGAGRIVFISSVLAEADGAGAVTGTVTGIAGGTATRKPLDYGASKRAAEKLLLEAHRTGRIETLILRPVNVYGPGMQGNLPRMIRLVRRGLLPPLPKFDNCISLVGVNDLARLIGLACTAANGPGGVYPVSDGVDYPVYQLEQAIYQSLGRKFPSWRLPRVLLYAVAATAGALGRTGRLLGLSPRHGGPGPRTYRNLATQKTVSNHAVREALGFIPEENFYDLLPSIVAGIDGN